MPDREDQSGKPRRRRPANPPPDQGADQAPDIIAAVREVLTPMAVQIDLANRRADDERARADRAQQRISDAETAERIAHIEAAGLRARVDELQAEIAACRAWWRRLLGR